MEPKGSVLMQRYEMGRLLGQGTFAKVYHARNLITGVSVAIKVIDKEKVYKVGMVDQIKREISVMRLVRHPNVVELYEVMASKTKIFIVMEYARGGELFHKIAKGKLKTDVARRYFQQLVSAVDYCHSRGVYHRDLKPENLLLDENENLKVSDFGLSTLSESKSQDGLLHTTCGTPAYVAPEVINRKGYEGCKAAFASWFFLSYPIGSTVHGYFNGVESSQTSGLSVSQKINTTSVDLHKNSSLDLVDNKTVIDLHPSIVSSGVLSDNSSKIEQIDTNSNSQLPLSESALPKIVPVTKEASALETSDSPPKEPIPMASTNSSIMKGCDLYHGNWIYDSSGPLYTNKSCPVLTQTQNCQGNGRPDKDYENWRWKPFQCDIPRFDPRKFLDLMRGKTLAFIGDSVARNQMESMMCILWQVEEPKNQGTRKMQRYYFESTSVTIVRIWSSWLVKHNSEPFDFAPAGVEKIYLKSPDEMFMEFLPTFDVVVLSSGHWFTKQSVYILNNEIVGGQLWWPDKSRRAKINSVEAFGISVETILTALVTHPNYTGLTILRSYSPDHYEGGGWNTGGSCTGKVKPLAPGELVENKYLTSMYEQQVTGFNRAAKKETDRSKMVLMDITEAFQYRHDGHPGPYRSTDPNKITKRGRNGRPPPQDCLHWCMPGPVDAWNEIVFEIIKREYDSDNTS